MLFTLIYMKIFVFLLLIYYICTQNTYKQYTSIKMKEHTHYIRFKATSKQAPNDACITFVERELARPKVKSVLAEKNKIGTWLSEQMERNLGTVSRWMTNKVQPSVEQLCDIVKHLDADVKKLLVASK